MALQSIYLLLVSNQLPNFVYWCVLEDLYLPILLTVNAAQQQAVRLISTMLIGITSLTSYNY